MSAVSGFLGLIVTAGAAALLIHGAAAPGAARLAEARTEAQRLDTEAAALTARIAAFDAAEGHDPLPPETFLPGETEAEAGLALQQQLVEAAGRAGLSLATFGVTPPPAELSRPAASVVLEGDGPIASIAAFLAELEAGTPPVALSQIVIRTAAGLSPEGAPIVSLRVTAWAFRQGEAG